MTRKTNPVSPLRIAIIGCGRITEIGHLPAILSLPSLKLTALVDTDSSRAKALKDDYAIDCEISQDFKDIVDFCDLAIIATPNSSHYEIASYLLENKIHTLVEKPLTIESREADHLSQIAQKNNCILSVGFVTRFFPSTTLMKEMIDNNYFGKIESFQYEFGSMGGWAPVSGYNLDKDCSGGGVLLVSGTHFIDRMLYWFGDPEILECSSDSHGGVEANFQAKFLFRKNGAELIGDFFVSKTYKLQNSFKLYGQYYDASLPEGQSEWIKVSPKNQALSFDYHVYPKKTTNKTELHYFILQLQELVQSIRLNRKSLVDGRDGSKSVKLVEEMYKKARRLSEPWLLVNDSKISKVKKPDREKILITGASGLVGGALCERLYLDKEYRFRAMVHSTGNAARIARLPIELVKADLLNKKEVDQAVKGCSMIVNLVRGGVPVHIKGFKNLLDAALKYNIKKFVHISSVAVYGQDPPEGSEEESFSPDPGDNKYGRLKLEQERIIQKYIKKGLPVVILRPPNIYGPFSVYSLMILNKIKADNVYLLHRGENPCNVVHVYNLVEAIILALESEKTAGEIYFITDGDPITWKDFIEANIALFEKKIILREISINDVTIKKSCKLNAIKSVASTFKFLISGEFRNMLSANVPLFGKINAFAFNKFQHINPKIQKRIKMLLSSPKSIPKIENNSIKYDSFIATQNRKVKHSIEKAKKELGYEPKLNLEAGIENTKLWLKSARYI